MKRIIEGIARFDKNGCAQLIGDTNIDLVFDRLAGERVRVTVETVGADTLPAGMRWESTDTGRTVLLGPGGAVGLERADIRSEGGHFFWVAYTEAASCQHCGSGDCSSIDEAKAAALAAVVKHNKLAKRFRWVRFGDHVNLIRVGVPGKEWWKKRADVRVERGVWVWRTWPSEESGPPVAGDEPAKSKSAAKRAAREAVERYDREHGGKP